jgi:hypothetical protein
MSVAVQTAPRTEWKAKKELREFGWIMGAVIAGLFGLAIPFLKHRAFPIIPWILAGAFWALAFISPESLKWVRKIWLKVGGVLGAINTRIILTVIYAILIVPMGLVMRLKGKDPMARKLEPKAKTYRLPRNEVSQFIQRMEKPY